MKIIDCVQGSDAWHEAHIGVPSASLFNRIVTPKTAKMSTQADDVIAGLIAGQIFGYEKDDWLSASMRDGLNTEAEAIAWYEIDSGHAVTTVGFCMDDAGQFGCSPDGLVGEDGGLELKCPEGKQYVKYLLEEGVPWQYRPQVHGSLIVTGRAWWDFMVYVPGVPPIVRRVVPDDYTEAVRDVLTKFHQKYRVMREMVLKQIPRPMDVDEASIPF